MLPGGSTAVSLLCKLARNINLWSYHPVLATRRSLFCGLPREEYLINEKKEKPCLTHPISALATHHTPPEMLLVSIFLLLLVSATSACDHKDHAELGWIFTKDRQNGDTTTPVYGDLDAKVRMEV